MPSRRVVSLLPSATEIVCALGAEAELVGISHECDFPPSVRGRVVLTASRLEPPRRLDALLATSGELDRAVRALVHEALSIYTVDEAALAALAPDVIITQDLCQVCAVSLGDVRSAVSRLASRASIDIVSLSPTRLGDVLGDLERVGVALGRSSQARALRSTLEARIAAIAARARAQTSRPRVLSVEWLEPIMLGGTWMPELIELAGGTPLGVGPGEPAPTVSSEALAELHADIVLIKPCGFALERTLTERRLIEERIVRHLAPATRVYVADGNAYFNRPGPRLVESLEILAALAHPEEFQDFDAAHRGVGFVSWAQEMLSDET